MKRLFKHRHRILAALVLLGVLAFVYAALVEREWIEETQVDVCCVDGESATPVKFAVLADLHARPGDGAYVDGIVQRILAAKPDAVLLLGDYLKGHREGQGMPLPELEGHLRPLAALPLFAVLGNHDYFHDPAAITSMLQRLGAHVMEERAGGGPVRFEKNGAKVDIGGIRCRYYFKTPGPVPQPRDGVPLVLLSHSPVGAEDAADGTALTVCGHSHGGQVCWPWGSPVYMADGKTPAAYAQGLMEIAGHRTYVTRGLGTSMLPIRFFCRPELTFLILSVPSGTR